MLSALLALTVRGSLVFGLVWLLELAAARRMHARNRRAWWWLAGFAFVLPLQLPILPPPPAPIAAWRTHVSFFAPSAATPPSTFRHVRVTAARDRLLDALPWIWAGGVAAALGVLGAGTWRTSRRWSRERLSTEPALLNLLEDCKAAAGIMAPIGLVVSDQIAAPALLGWLRPRILLPRALVADLSPTRLRPVLLHELAHFRACDLALHWVFSIACAVHWFNPLVHFAARRWLHFRELAADEAALAWLAPAERPAYGDALIAALKHAAAFPTPHGALALGESLQNLKHRLVMITRHASLARHGLLALVVSCALSGLLLVQSLRAEKPDTDDPKAAAVSAMHGWLADIDAGHYAKSWEDASALFKSKVTSEKWQEQIAAARAPLGACGKREQVSAMLQERVPSPEGGLQGPFVVVQFHSSFANLSSAQETVTFMREADGTWKAAGYYIKAR